MDTAKKAASKLLAKAGNIMMDELSNVQDLNKYSKLSIRIANNDDFVNACKRLVQ